MISFSQVLKPTKWLDWLEEEKKRFSLAKKIFWREGHFHRIANYIELEVTNCQHNTVRRLWGVSAAVNRIGHMRTSWPKLYGGSL